jgi:TPR repeat protein
MRFLAFVVGLCFALCGTAQAARGARSLSAGIAAYHRQAYVLAASIFQPLAEKGYAKAETYLGFMYAHGWGVPQNYEIAAHWYDEAARRGEALAQYMLGLSYDKGQGVPQDYVIAYVWLSLAVAHASPKDREYWMRIRDAVSSKLSLSELTYAQHLATDWDLARK